MESSHAKKWDAAAKRHLGRGLTEPERHASEWYPSENADPDEWLAWHARMLRIRSGSGRHAASADVAAPEWWDFYIERAVRDTWGDLARALRDSIGLLGPLRVEDAWESVTSIVERSKVPQQGAVALLFVPRTSGLEGDFVKLYTGLDGHVLAGNHPLDDVLDAVVRNGGDLAYLALVYTALCGGRDTTTIAGTTAIEFHAFVLCDFIRPRPWLRWDVHADYFTSSITLHIPTLAVTPEQVRALYEQAREAIASVGSEGPLVPVAVKSDRIALVRFVESRIGSGPLDWSALHKEWKERGIGSEYATVESFESQYRTAAKPWKLYKSRKRDAT